MHKRSMLWAGGGVLLLGGPAGSAEVGRLAGPFPRTGGPSPLRVSTRFVLAAADLQRGAAVPLIGGPAQVVLLGLERAASALVITDPTGERLGPGHGGMGELRRFLDQELLEYGLPSHGLAVRLQPLVAGVHTLRSEGPRGGPVALVVNEEGSDLELRVQTTPLAARAGEPIIVDARLLFRGRPVGDANVVAQVLGTAQSRAPLRLDEVAPGIYRSSLTAVAAEATAPLALRIDAHGMLGGGAPFARTALSGASLASGAVDVDLASVAVRGAALSVPVVGLPGDYRLEAVFGAYVAGELTSLAYSREDFHLTADGAAVALAVPPAAAGAERLALRLVNRGTLAVEREVELPLEIVAERSAGTATAADARAVRQSTARGRITGR